MKEPLCNEFYEGFFFSEFPNMVEIFMIAFYSVLSLKILWTIELSFFFVTRVDKFQKMNDIYI